MVGCIGNILLSCLVTLFISLNAYAEPTKITLLHNDLSFLYTENTRFSVILRDAYNNTDYSVYSLGTSLINPQKQHLIDSKKTSILEKLYKLDSFESRQLAQQLEHLEFVYKEEIEGDITKVNTFKEYNPIIKGKYLLWLPERPKTILLVNARLQHPLYLSIKPNYSLKDYVIELSDSESYKSVWIIQADNSTHLASDFTWRNVMFFLSPGAIIFNGLDGLPAEYKNLNSQISDLLTFWLDR